MFVNKLPPIPNAVILRRRKLGRTSVREIARKSTSNIIALRSDRDFIESPLYFRWGCTETIPCNNVINTARSIHEVNDKTRFRQTLNEEGLCPATYFSVTEAETANEYPYVMRPRLHSRGRHLYVCNDLSELERAALTCGQGYYVSKLIQKAAEYRAFIAQGRVVCVAQKTPSNPQDVAWNVARGGRFDNVRFDNWPLKCVRMSVEAFNLSNLDFGGVDVMTDSSGAAYIIEINSAPSLTSEYRQTCFAKVFDYIITHGKERIPLIKSKGGYRKFVHPAISDRARLE